MAIVAQAACFTLASFVTAAAQTAPMVVSGKIDSPVLHIGTLPASPQITLNLRGKIDRVTLAYAGPSVGFVEATFYTKVTDGKHVFAGYGAYSTLPPYAEAGTWTLSSVQVCTVSSMCSFYTGTTLTPLFPSLTFKVINPHSDFTVPIINSASITTPIVSATNSAQIKVVANMQDSKSGVVYAAVTFVDSTGKNNIVVGGGLNYPVKAAASYALVDYCVCAKTPPSTYTAVMVTLYSAASTQTVITDPDQISSLFGGQPTFSLTN